jgi:hypothetical protein
MSSIFRTPKDLATALSEFSGTVATRIADFQNERKKADLYEATGFTVFDYLDSDENRISDVICDLLDPSGKHGRGEIAIGCAILPRPETYQTKGRTVPLVTANGR